MDYTQTERRGGDLVVRGLKNFCLDDILGCGQCFRWERLEPGVWRGIAFGVCRTVRQDGCDLILYGCDEREFEALWLDYFDLGRDYDAVKARLCADGFMRGAVEFTPGMRVLRQEPWEALCSFILSQNNNIKRIRGLVARLCEAFGEPVDGGFAFPAPERLAGLAVEDLAPVRCGFRAKYVLDAARRVASGELKLSGLRSVKFEEACLELQRIAGVGPKVARCALLYGFGFAESVPVDVWINRALTEFYPDGMPAAFAEIAGLGQQYLFHYMRHRAAAPGK